MDPVIFTIGTIVGSFLNVCIYRIPLRESIVSPASRCTVCGTHIPARYNIPLVGFILLLGRCHSCRARISLRYPIVELLSGILTLFTYMRYGLSAEFVFYTLFLYFLVVISLIDIRTRLIYNRMLLWLIGSGIVLNIILNVVPWSPSLIGVLVGGSLMFAIALLGQLVFRKDALGMGDIKLMAVAGFFIGWQDAVLATFLAFFLAMLAGIGLMASKKLDVNSQMPFGPFLAMAIGILMFWGPQLIQWYWNVIGMKS